MNTSLTRSRRVDATFNQKTILGGDFNTILNMKLDRKGGSGNLTAEYIKSIKLLNQMQEDFDLSDEWRIRNPDIKRYTWRQKTPQIFSRLDMLFISKSLCDSVREIDIIPSVKSDHSPILMTIRSDQQEKGRGLWKLNRYRASKTIE
jgi:exonuclease III